MTVSFGMSENQYDPDSLRLHDSLHKRQAAVPSTVSYPSAPTATATLTANASSHNISYQAPADLQLFSFSAG